MQPENNEQNSAPITPEESSVQGSASIVSEEPKLEAVTEEVVAVETKPETAESPKSDIVFNDKPKKNSGMILGMVLLAILAIGGIGFGVWAMMDGDQKTKTLNNQITSLQQQNDELTSQVSELQTKVEEYESSSTGSYEILPPKWGEAVAVIEEDKFTIKNAEGETYLQLDDVVVEEIIACDSGTASAQSPLICTVKTKDGNGKVVYNYDEHSVEYTETTD